MITVVWCYRVQELRVLVPSQDQLLERQETLRLCQVYWQSPHPHGTKYYLFHILAHRFHCWHKTFYYWETIHWFLAEF